MELSQESDSKSKIPRVRSVAYPSNTISHCTSLTETIYKFFGNAVYIPREKICEKTGISDGHIQTQLSSCVQYGLLELKPGEGYKPSSLFIRIYKPQPRENVAEAKIEAFKNPDLYKKIIAGHNNETHTVDGLATILFRNYKVADNASKLAAKIFLDNAKELSLYNSDNLFNIDGDGEAVEVVEDGVAIQNKPSDEKPLKVEYLPPSRENAEPPKKFNSPPIPIFFDDGSVAEVYLPDGFNKDKIKRIIKVLSAQVE